MVHLAVLYQTIVNTLSSWTQEKEVTREAIQVNPPQKFEESNSVFWVFRKVLVNHVECWFENRVKDGWYLWCQQSLRQSRESCLGSEQRTYTESACNSGHHIQDLCVPSCRHIAIVVAKNSVEKWWHKVAVDGIQILRLLDVCLHQLQNVLLHGS
jgi:hypothetical protein